MIRVLLAEDQAMVRGALSALLALEGDIEVVDQVARGDEIVDAAERVMTGRRAPGHRAARASTA